ncbi:hypothetical protein RRG37_02700 [Mycoplasmopsis felis]|uniref:DNA polymerase III subunit delta n=1 Tax=Mycoplasmopsis felis TaxID=33923 RepID=UPI002AFE9032|nr:hypothetical protein [Mycoplasmopsis felis]WQQ06256.1 hypothetical protein RRG40_00265 [Mycoplasmopsis felis]
MYFIYGQEDYYINEKLSELQKVYKQENIIILKENYEIIEFLNSFLSESLFDIPKLYIVYDFPLFLSSKLTKKESNFIDLFIQTFSKKQKNTLIFVLNKEKPSNNKFTDFIINNFEVFEFKKTISNQWNQKINEFIFKNNIKITQTDLFYFIEKNPKDLTFVLNELDKLNSLKTNQIITREFIDNYISDVNLNQTFAFMNSLETNNISKIYEKYKERTNEGDSIILLVSQLFNIFNLCFSIYLLKQLKYSDYKIAQELNIQEWRYKKLLQILRTYEINKIKNILTNLSFVDFDLKTTEILDVDIFETYLITNFF